MPRWLQWLLGAAALCIIGVTIAIVILAAVVIPGIGERASSEVDARLDELMEELEQSVGTALDPTEQQIEQLDDSLSEELRTIREKIERLEAELEQVESHLDEINTRDEEAFRLSRRE